MASTCWDTAARNESAARLGIDPIRSRASEDRFPPMCPRPTEMLPRSIVRLLLYLLGTPPAPRCVSSVAFPPMLYGDQGKPVPHVSTVCSVRLAAVLRATPRKPA